MFLQPFIPTPTPGAIQQLGNQVNNLTDAYVQFSSRSQDYVTNTGLLGVIFAAIIVYALVSYWQRGRGGELSSVIKTQNRLLESQEKRFEDERQERRKRDDEDREDKRKFQERYLETISAMTAAQNATLDLTQEIKAVAIANNTRDLKDAGIIERLERAVTQVVTEGSEPVKMIRDGMDIMLQRTENIATTTILMQTQQTNVEKQILEVKRLYIDATMILSTLQGAIEKLEKRKTQPIPTLPASTPEPSAI